MLERWNNFFVMVGSGAAALQPYLAWRRKYN